MRAQVTLAFTAGMVAAFNPCGFAMLPAYLSWFLGQEGDTGESRSVGVLRSLAVGGAVSLGFLAVFGTAGLVVRHLFASFNAYTPYVTIVIGLGILIPLGILRLAGREVKLALPRFKQAVRGRGLGSMVVFGASYATVSLSCTLTTFLVPVAGTFQESSFLAGLTVFGSYAAGMCVVLMALTLTLGLAKGSMVRHFRRALPYVGRVSGGLLVVAGAYIAYYGWYEIGVLAGRDVAAGPVGLVQSASDKVRDWLASAGELVVGG
ncbi:MAG: cytochrome c biogenesis CcdA family protein, partial [Acidimicrobiia bacterium]